MALRDHSFTVSKLIFELPIPTIPWRGCTAVFRNEESHTAIHVGGMGPKGVSLWGVEE